MKRYNLRWPILFSLLPVLVGVAVFVNVQYIRSAPVRAHLQRGAKLAELGDWQGAEKEWRMALRLDPSRLETYKALSILYLHTDNPAQALPLLERIRQRAPRSEHASCNLAEAYARLGQNQKALEIARQATFLEPQCPRALALLGIALGESGDKAGAVTALKRAVALAPTDDKIAVSLAQAQIATGACEDAEQIARKVTSRNPYYATAWRTLSDSLIRRHPTPDHLREAIAALQKAKELDPQWMEGNVKLKRLQQMLQRHKNNVPRVQAALTEEEKKR